MKEAVIFFLLRYDPYIRESLKYNKLTGRIDIVKILWWNDEICKLDDDAERIITIFLNAITVFAVKTAWIKQ